MSLLRFLFFFALCAPALAAPPIEFDGRLMNANLPVNDQVELTFALYESEDSDIALWTEVHEDVSVVDGRFKVFLFYETDISADDLGIETLFIGWQLPTVKNYAPAEECPRHLDLESPMKH